MPAVPCEFAAWLTSVGLPLGPLTGPLTYFRRGRGKLHPDPGCSGLSVRGVETGLPVTRTADQVRAADLCGHCGHSLPVEADRWGQVCRQIAMTRAAAIPPADVGTWQAVTALDNSRLTLEWFDTYRVDDNARPELGPHLTAAYQLLDDARRIARSAAPDDLEVLAVEARSRQLLPATADAAQLRVVALCAVSGVTLMHSYSERSSVAELLARVELLGEGSYRFTVAPAAVAALLVADTPSRTGELDAHDAGPAQACDTPAVLATAARLLAERTSTAVRDPFPVATLPDELTGLLTAARGIHHPVV